MGTSDQNDNTNRAEGCDRFGCAAYCLTYPWMQSQLANLQFCIARNNWPVLLHRICPRFWRSESIRFQQSLKLVIDERNGDQQLNKEIQKSHLSHNYVRTWLWMNPKRHSNSFTALAPLSCSLLGFSLLSLGRTFLSTRQTRYCQRKIIFVYYIYLLLVSIGVSVL